MARFAIPDQLGSIFRVADGRAAGVGEKRMRGADLLRPFHGVRARAECAEPDDGPQEEQRRAILRAVQRYGARMTEHEFVSHSTAVLLWGGPLPMLRDELPHIAVLGPRRLPRAAGIHGHEAQPSLTRVVRHPRLGVRIASPATAWAMLGAELRHPYDLVAAADGLVRIPRMPGGYVKDLDPPIATIAQLEAALFAGRRVGKPALREALACVRTGSASRPETWMRLIIVDAGLPEPVIDYDVYDDAGIFLGCVDQAYPSRKIALEYEGDHHRTDPMTWARDIAKHDRLVEAGWRVLRVTRTEIFAEPGTFVARIRRALHSRS